MPIAPSAPAAAAATQASWQTGVLDPQGPVAAAQLTILGNATVIMLAVIVPIMVLVPALAWWYRKGNAKAAYKADFDYAGPLEVLTWSVPLLVIIFLAGMGWLGSHALDPRRPLDSPVEPLVIEVVSLDWKWLFIQPAAGVASVNRLVVPAGVPLRLHLSSATVMNSFFVPQLGSQIYAMHGMTTQLNLMADHPGTYPGFSAQFSGQGFSQMRFDLVALAPAPYRQWLQQARATPDRLDNSAYQQLMKPGTTVPTALFGSVDPTLFRRASGADAMAAVCRAPPQREARNRFVDLSNAQD